VKAATERRIVFVWLSFGVERNISLGACFLTHDDAGGAHVQPRLAARDYSHTITGVAHNKEIAIPKQRFTK
jgi:hypothetical protein